MQKTWSELYVIQSDRRACENTGASTYTLVAWNIPLTEPNPNQQPPVIRTSQAPKREPRNQHSAILTKAFHFARALNDNGIKRKLNLKQWDTESTTSNALLHTDSLSYKVKGIKAISYSTLMKDCALVDVKKKVIVPWVANAYTSKHSGKYVG